MFVEPTVPVLHYAISVSDSIDKVVADYINGDVSLVHMISVIKADSLYAITQAACDTTAAWREYSSSINNDLSNI
jgi:hypothetical protein